MTGITVEDKVAIIVASEATSRGAQLAGEKLRLFPCGEVCALVDLVEVDQVAICALCLWSGDKIAGPRSAFAKRVEGGEPAHMRGAASTAARPSGIKANDPTGATMYSA